MEKLPVLLMVLLFAVTLTSQTIFDDEGIKSDAIAMKDNTQAIIGDANDQMSDFSGAAAVVTP